jgi:methionine synthase I (cobalamin-dependent)
MSRYDAIREKLHNRKFVILDGAIGTEILRRDVSWADHQNLARPDVIRAISEDYIAAGADVITTNTFQLTRRAILNHFKDEAHMKHIGAPGIDTKAPKEIEAAVELCKEARKKKGTDNVIIAGAITTLEWCFRPDMAPNVEQAKKEYRETVETMKNAGADIILLETMNNTAETAAAVEACNEVGIPVWTAFVCDNHGDLLNGEKVERTVEVLSSLKPDTILLNCAPPTDIDAGMQRLVPKSKEIATGAYPHIGRFNPPEWLFTDEYPPARYVQFCEKWANLGARVLGGCCGTTPDHIAALSRRFKG